MNKIYTLTYYCTSLGDRYTTIVEAEAQQKYINAVQAAQQELDNTMDALHFKQKNNLCEQE